MGEAEINMFLSHLATVERVSASTQNQAVAALLFLYHTVLGGDVGNMDGVIRPRRRPHLPVVLTVDKDVDMEKRCITVRCGQGDKDRRTVLPSSLVEALQRHMQGVRGCIRPDLAAGWGTVEPPPCLGREYRNATRECAWQWLFPQGSDFMPAT